MNSTVIETDCCIVGGGPAGAILALLLARQGVSVVLLEAHKNFDRDWRGDTIHRLYKKGSSVGLILNLLFQCDFCLHSAKLLTFNNPLLSLPE